jgi:hypothetical protein
MSSTLGQSSLNFPNVPNENDNTTKSSNNDSSRLTEQRQKQIIVKNIDDLPRDELEEFLKVYIYLFRKNLFYFICIEIWSNENPIG